VSTKQTSSLIDNAATQLRDLALKTPNGELLGSEDEIVERLNVSKVTARQAARLLEREGVLFVKRGKKGGYFSARPSGEMIETVMCAYMNTLGLSQSHTGSIATALWVEALREAAGADRAASAAMAAEISKLVEALPPEATLADLAKVEREMRSAVFNLIDGAYIDLIFRINAAFARQKLKGHTEQQAPDRHHLFVKRWKMAKLMELDAIAQGDALQAVAAGMHERSLWHGRATPHPMKSET
jgi:GntR family transcriptional regulator, transcriptional repressor for pyruvate dehydrogenase complex